MAPNAGKIIRKRDRKRWRAHSIHTNRLANDTTDSETAMSHSSFVVIRLWLPMTTMPTTTTATLVVVVKLFVSLFSLSPNCSQTNDWTSAHQFIFCRLQKIWTKHTFADTRIDIFIFHFNSNCFGSHYFIATKLSAFSTTSIMSMNLQRRAEFVVVHN